MKDLLNNKIKLPNLGDQAIINGCNFTVTSVIPDDDLCIVATISLRNESGEIEVGYYDFII